MKNLTCTLDNSLMDCLKKINENTMHTIFIVDDNHMIQGVLTDGDIRRLQINGRDLAEKVSSPGILNKDFIFGYADQPLEKLHKLTSHRINILPIVSREGKLVDYYEFSTRIKFPIAAPNLSKNELDYLIDAYMSTWISSSGKYLDRLEKDFADFCGVENALTTSSGTTALHLALLALDVGPGDEVIVPDLTFAATINVVLYAGATPVIVDIEPDSWCMSPEAFRAAITPKTKVVIPVHLYGQPADMGSIGNIATEHGIRIVEDCAEAHGASFGNSQVGAIGDIGCYSFYGNKIITTGEGGICVTGDKRLADKMRLLRDHGMSKEKRYWHEDVGYNYRMTNLQAAIGCGQLERIQSILSEREQIRAHYQKELKGCNWLEFQSDSLPNRKNVVWLVSGLLKDCERDDVISKAKSKGYELRPFFYPLSSMPLYEKYAAEPCKVSAYVGRHGISFPTDPSVLHEDLNWLRMLV